MAILLEVALMISPSISQRFNEELENIFEAVNAPSKDIISIDAATSLRHDDVDQEFSEKSHCSISAMVHGKHQCADSGNPCDSQLGRLLQKAVQDRSLAEQQAR